MTTAISLPIERFEAEKDRPTTVTDSTSHQVIGHAAPGTRISFASSGASRRAVYNPGLLSSFSFFVSTAAAWLGPRRALDALFRDMQHYAALAEARAGYENEFYSLYEDYSDLTNTQTWTMRPYTLSTSADSSIPLFPEEDFEG